MTFVSKKIIPVLPVLLLVGVFFMLTLPAFAQEEGIVQCGGYLQDPCTICDIPVTIDRLIDYIIFNFVTPAAILMVMAGGFMILTAGPSPQRVETGKKILTNTLVGILIIFFSWMIVNTILVVLGTSQGGVGGFQGIGRFIPWNQLPATGEDCPLGGLVSSSSESTGPPPSPTPAPTPAPIPSPTGTWVCPGRDASARYATKEECDAACNQGPNFSTNVCQPYSSKTPQQLLQERDQAVRNRLTASEITVNNTDLCPLGVTYQQYRQQTGKGCTTVADLPELAIRTLVNMKNACGAPVRITGGTEAGHGSHGPGIPTVDLSFDQKLADCLKNTLGVFPILQICTASQDAKYRRNCSTNEEVRHLHIRFSS